jgi:hypothetical protein
MATRRPSITRALARSLREAQLTPREEASATLARRLAIELDAAEEPADIVRLARSLNAVLTSLGMNRQLRTQVAAAGGATVDDPAAVALADLRARRGAHPDG